MLYVFVLVVVHFVVCFYFFVFFFFKQKTAYEMRISDWSSDVCSSDLGLILSNVSSLKLGKKQMEHIRDYVRDHGGGLIMIGGEEIGRASCRERVCQYV